MKMLVALKTTEGWDFAKHGVDHLVDHSRPVWSFFEAEKFAGHWALKNTKNAIPLLSDGNATLQALRAPDPTLNMVVSDEYFRKIPNKIEV